MIVVDHLNHAEHEFAFKKICMKLMDVGRNRLISNLEDCLELGQDLCIEQAEFWPKFVQFCTE